MDASFKNPAAFAAGFFFVQKYQIDCETVSKFMRISFFLIFLFFCFQNFFNMYSYYSQSNSPKL